MNENGCFSCLCVFGVAFGRCASLMTQVFGVTSAHCETSVQHFTTKTIFCVFQTIASFCRTDLCPSCAALDAHVVAFAWDVRTFLDVSGCFLHSFDGFPDAPRLFIG